MSWRDRARPIIERVPRETEGQPARDVRQALRDAYPFGPRTHHPYKVWCDEIARQQGRKPPLGTRGVKRLGPIEADPRQGDLFDARR